MTPKKWYKRAAAMLTAFALMFVLIPFAGRAAVSAVAGAGAEKAVTLTNVKLLLNGKEVTDSTKVNNGDEVFFAFDWSVNKSADEVLKNPLVADIDFQGIYLLENNGPLQQGTVDKGTYKIIKTDDGNKIEFYVEEDQLKESNIKGQAVFKGNISYTAKDVGSDGKFDIKASAQGNPLLTLRPEATVKANAWVNKQADGQLYKEGGKYYQNYTVTVNANSASTGNYTITSIKDTPVDTSKSSVSGNITATASSNDGVTGLLSSYSSFDAVKGIVLQPGASVTFKYRMEVDKSVITDRYNTWTYGNKVVVNNKLESSASPSVPEILVPSVYKSGRLDRTNNKIIWTLEIGYMDFTGNKDTDKAKVQNMEDILHEDPATKEELTVVGNEFSMNDFWAKAKADQVTVWDSNGNPQKRWRYTYSYETTYEDNGVSVDKVFRNDFNTEIDGFEYNRSAYVTVPSGVNPVDKKFDGVDANGDLNWTITFKVPSDNVFDITITDVLGADNGLSHEIVDGSIAVSGSNDYAIKDNTIEINDSHRAGDVITITLKTRRDDIKSTGRYYNTAKAKFVQTVNQKNIDIEREDTDQYEVRSIVSKSADGNISGNSDGKLTGENKIGWCVTVDLNNLKNVTPKTGDIITLTDVAVMQDNEGQQLDIKGIYKLQLGGNMWWTPNASSVVTDEFLNNGDVSLSGNTITVKLNQRMINEKTLLIFYYQEVSDPTQLEGNYLINNTVSATYKGEDAGTAHASQYEGFTKEEILKKESDGKGNLVHYTVEVNKPGLKMGGDEDNVYLDDVMGSRLRFQESTLTVTDGDGNPLDESLWSYTYNSTARKLSVTLPDETYCKVLYDAIIDVEIRNLGGRNGYFIGGKEVELSSIYNEITNTASLSGSGGYSSSKSDTWSEADVSGNATIISDTGDLVVDKYDSLTGLHLNGAEFSLVPGKFNKGEFKPYVNDGAHPSFNEIISYDTGNEADTLIQNLEFGILYEITEVKAPEEYRVFEGARYIVIRKPGDANPSSETIGVIPSGKRVEYYIAGETISIANDPNDDDTVEVTTTVKLSKREVGKSEELPGARIRIERLSGNAYMQSRNITITGGMTDVARTPETISFTSGSSPAVIKGLPAGSYRMVEDTAPVGYAKASAITFNVRILSNGTYSITVNGKVLKDDLVIMDDELNEMSISKQDVFGAELPGAKLTLTGTDNEGNDINFAALGSIITSNNTITTTSESISFVSGTVPTKISGLIEGDYVLHEDAAPAGYLLAQDISFAIDERGNVRLPNGGGVADNKLIMTDERTYVLIKKTDIAIKSGMGDAPQIPGAVMEITGTTPGLSFNNVKVYNGKNVNITSNGVEFTTTSYEAEIRGLPAGQYVLTETAAPDGYETVTTNFTFTVNENGTVAGSGTDEEYRYDPVLHRITMMDKIKTIKRDEDVTLGMSGLPISKISMTDLEELPGAVLTIKVDDSIVSDKIGDVSNAVVRYEGAPGEVINANGDSLTFTTRNVTAYVSGLPEGYYVLTEDAAPAGYDLTTDFHFRVILKDKEYSVVAGKNNGYNVIRSDGTVIIRDYPEGVKEDPDEPEKEVTSVTTQTVSITQTTTDMQTYANLEATTTTTYPRRPSYTGPFTGERPGNEGPGSFIDPSVTEHIDRHQPSEPLESEDIKAGIYVVEQDSGSGAKDAAIFMAVTAVMASAVYALSKALKRRRSK
ncbi:MAG: hypothetical protein K2K57_08195 [Oscillospiraceae bacterium]|nr:hypothetical protein [Oscillospiraceae bacterium]